MYLVVGRSLFGVGWRGKEERRTEGGEKKRRFQPAPPSRPKTYHAKTKPLVLNIKHLYAQSRISIRKNFTPSSVTETAARFIGKWAQYKK